jgi:EAL domain-containing protein (putative c-di-GMP-specific phosphodiesterase class I)
LHFNVKCDYLNIDGSFIKNLPHDKKNQHLVKAIVEMAHGLGKQTIAEFVECEKTVQLLLKYGVDYAQGYHIGKPSKDYYTPLINLKLSLHKR